MLWDPAPTKRHINLHSPDEAAILSTVVPI
jgi:hypothetical protein